MKIYNALFKHCKCITLHNVRMYFHGNILRRLVYSGPSYTLKETLPYMEKYLFLVEIRSSNVPPLHCVLNSKAVGVQLDNDPISRRLVCSLLILITQLFWQKAFPPRHSGLFFQFCLFTKPLSSDRLGFFPAKKGFD